MGFFNKTPLQCIRDKSHRGWLQQNIPAFIVTENWPSGSPDLNQLDYQLSDILEMKACGKHQNLDLLKADLIKQRERYPVIPTMLQSMSGPIHWMLVSRLEEDILNEVCVPMPTHCTITCFRFHTRWIDGVKCGLFSNHAPLGQTTLRVGWVSV